MGDGFVAWRIGIAEGEMIPLGAASSHTRLGWGPPLVRAIALARAARPGEVLIDPDVGAVARGEVLTSGSRAGKDSSRPVEGLVVDPRHALRSEVEATVVTRLERPALVANGAALRELLGSSAPLGVIRAAPGFGGSRMLAEIESALLPARSLYLAGAGAEPLGSLRRAFAQSIARQGDLSADALPNACRRALERLLAGDGIDLRLGAELVLRWVTLLRAPDGRRPRGAVLVDDAMEVDDPSLDVVANAARIDPGSFLVVARIDQAANLPPLLQSLSSGPVVNLGRLPRSSGEQLAASAAQGMISTESARRWARRGGFIPLGIMEALADGLANEELSGLDSVPSSRTGTADAHVQLEPKDWISRRLRLLGPEATQMLRAVAILGVAAEASLVHELASEIGIENVASLAASLVGDRWLASAPEGFYSLPSRTHREVIVADISEHEAARWHDAASSAIERVGGNLASAEAARHAALAGEQQRAVELAMVAATTSRQLELEAATDALLAFAGASPDDIAPLPTSTADYRLMSWIDGLRSGERDVTAVRLRAIASLSKGETSEALAALREGVHLAEGQPAAARSRALLAYGIALAVAQRPSEALFAALEALARAREGRETRGARACARFLARLSLAAGHREASVEWQQAAAEAE
jgi:hypothetical protein